MGDGRAPKLVEKRCVEGSVAAKGNGCDGRREGDVGRGFEDADIDGADGGEAIEIGDGDLELVVAGLFESDGGGLGGVGSVG